MAEAPNAQEALALLDRQQFDVAVIDMNMPGISGVELLQRMKSENIETEVIILTGQGTIESAVQAMKIGACDYLTKPFPLGDLEQRCRLAWERGRLGKENRQLKEVIKRAEPKSEMVGQSAQMKEVFRLIERMAPTDKTFREDLFLPASSEDVRPRQCAVASCRKLALWCQPDCCGPCVPAAAAKTCRSCQTRVSPPRCAYSASIRSGFSSSSTVPVSRKRRKSDAMCKHRRWF